MFLVSPSYVKTCFIFHMAKKILSVLKVDYSDLFIFFLSIHEATSLAVRLTTRQKGMKSQSPPPATTLLEVRSFFHPLLNSNRIEEHRQKAVGVFPRFHIDFCEIEVGFRCGICLNACKDYFIGRPESHHKQEQQDPTQKTTTKQSTPSFLAKCCPCLAGGGAAE
ncbi:unnamed protein product [Urochloa decumbens]|uniref:Uncharacterized protein n=1 Tax=Urochloa decumbens TaxID=240449 RepID=A0ABC9AX86_9POAL